MESRAFEQQYKEWAEQQWPDAGERAKNDWILAAVRQHMRWGEGREVSAADFEAAVAEVRGLQLGGGGPPEQP